MKNFLKNDYFLLIISMVLPNIYKIFNRYLIGYMGMSNIIVTNSFSIVDVITEFILEFFSIGVIVLIAKKKTKCLKNQFLGSCISLSLAITGIFVLFSLLFSDVFFNYVNISNISIPEYIFFISKISNVPFAILFIIIVNALKGIKEGKVSLILIVSNLFLNFLFDILLISESYISLKLGLIGLGLSTLLTNLFSLIIGLKLLKSKLDFKLNDLKIRRGEVLKLFAFGKWILIESFIRNLMFVNSILIIVNKCSKVEIVNYNTINILNWNFLLIPILIISELYKINLANNENYSIKLNSIILKSVLIYLSISLVTFLFLNPICQFLNSSINTFNNDIKLLYLIMCFYFSLFTIINLYSNHYYALGNSKKTMIVNVIINLCFLLPLGILNNFNIINLNIISLMIILSIINILQILLFKFDFKKLPFI